MAAESCCLNFDGDIFKNNNLLKFTAKSLSTAINKAEIWKTLEVRESHIASKFISVAGSNVSDPSPIISIATRSLRCKRASSLLPRN